MSDSMSRDTFECIFQNFHLFDEEQLDKFSNYQIQIQMWLMSYLRDFFLY